MSGQCCNNVHLSMDDTFIQWNEILGDPSTSTALVEFVNQKIAGAGGDINALIDEKIKEATSEMKEELQEIIDEKVVEIDPYKIIYRDTTVGDALDDLTKATFTCKVNELGEYEKGQTLTSLQVSWEMSENPYSQKIVRLRNGNIIESIPLDVNVRSYTFTNVTTDERYVVGGITPDLKEFDVSVEVKFKSRMYYGTSDSPNPSDAIVTNWSSILVDKDTDLGRRIFDCENGDYIYFAVPDDLHLTYDFFSNGMKDGNWVYEVRNLTNQYGYVKPYRIYHTGNILHGYNIYIEVESHDWY